MAANSRENSRGGVFPERSTSQRLAYVGDISLRIASVRSYTRETSGSSLLQRQRETSIATKSRENSRGGCISRETSGRLAYRGDISPRISSVRSNTGETSGSSLLQRQRKTSMTTNPRENSRGGRMSREKYVGENFPTIIEIPADMVERLCMQESLQSLPGSVPSGPHDGLVRKPLCQEDTCHRLEHTTSHQK